MEICPLDITYCTNAGCPFKTCDRHPAVLKKVQQQLPGATVSVSDLSGTCREYIGWLVEGGNGVKGEGGNG